MKIEQIDANKIRVTVDSRDQAEFGVTYESMDYSDSNTRRLCEKIMTLARTQVGFSVGNAKLLVEARQSCNGSVTLYLSRVPVLLEDTQLYCQTLVYRSPDYLLDSRRLFSEMNPDGTRAEMYLWEGKYYLYLELMSTHQQAKGTVSRFLEYAERSPLSRAFLREHGVCLENAAMFLLRKADGAFIKK